MTPEWFEDLAQRLSEASMFAFYDDEPSMCRDFQMARTSALDYARSQRAELEKIRAEIAKVGPIELAAAKEVDQRHIA